MKTLTFNTGRTYTEHGQRIVATQIDSGHIVMLDIDRHIDVLLPAQIEFTKSDIMWAYDNNIQVFPSEISLSYGDYYEILNQLHDVANITFSA